MLNRGVVIVRPKQPYLDWAAGLEDSGIVPDPNDEQTVCLIPSYGDDEEAWEILEGVHPSIFENELYGWHTDETAWPQGRDLAMFKAWFEIELHSVVEDLGDDEIVDEDDEAYQPRAGLTFATIHGPQVAEFLEKRKLGRLRVGKTPEERLGWVIAFARGDLDRLRPEERVAIGYDLRALIPRTWAYKVPVAPLHDGVLRSIHEEVRRGIDSLLRKGRWQLRAALRVVLMREEDEDEDQAAPSSRVGLSWRGTEEQAILGGVMDLLLAVGDRLRACAHCGEAFVKRKRQAYCSTACSQRARDQRKSQGRQK